MPMREDKEKLTVGKMLRKNTPRRPQVRRSIQRSLRRFQLSTLHP